MIFYYGVKIHTFYEGANGAADLKAVFAFGD